MTYSAMKMNQKIRLILFLLVFLHYLYFIKVLFTFILIKFKEITEYFERIKHYTNFL